MPFYHCPTGCPASIGKGQVPIEAPSEPWPEPPGGPIRGSLDEEPEDETSSWRPASIPGPTKGTFFATLCKNPCISLKSIHLSKNCTFLAGST